MKESNSNINLKKIAIGTVQFGLNYGIANSHGQTSEEEARAILSKAKEYGIHTLDTAVAYGSSEEVLGKLDVKSWEVISKFPKPEKGGSVRSYLESSLKHLNREHLSSYIAHNAQVFLDEPLLWNQLVDLKKEGLVKKIGFSLYTPSELERLLDSGLIPDLIQIPYNIIDRRFESYFQNLKEMGIEIHTRSSFLQGLFFMKPADLSPYFNELLPFLKEFDKSFDNNKQKAAHLLDFCISQEKIDKVVIGVNTVEQLMENIEGLQLLENKTVEYPAISDESILLPYNWPKN